MQLSVLPHLNREKSKQVHLGANQLFRLNSCFRAKPPYLCVKEAAFLDAPLFRKSSLNIWIVVDLIILDSFAADQVYYFLSILKNSSYLSFRVFSFLFFFNWWIATFLFQKFPTNKKLGCLSHIILNVLS